jgi:crotonobetainyl-CoA:carnitine CoA-transferase CaiB-like acyl-CoA transferase
MTTWHPPHELAASYLRALGREHRVQRTGNRLPSTHPFSILPCADGHVGVITLTFTQWELLCRMMGIEELLEDPELQNNAGRVANSARVDAAMSPWLLARTAEQCFHEAQAWRIPFSLVPDVAAILSSPQHAERGYFTKTTHPEAETYQAPGPAFYPSGGARHPQQPAPRLGRDNGAIYGALGLRPDEISALAERGVV